MSIFLRKIFLSLLSKKKTLRKNKVFFCVFYKENYILSSFIDYSVLTEAFKDKLISKDKDVEFFEEFEIEK